MGESFLEFMKGIGIFIICAQSFLYFSAGKSYEKYVKLLIGVMILAQFVVPVRSLFSGTNGGELQAEVERFQAELEYAMKTADMTVQEKDFVMDDADSVESVEEEIGFQLADAAAGYGYQIAEVQLLEEPPKVVVIVESMEEAQAQSAVGKAEKERVQIDKIAAINKIEIGQRMEQIQNSGKTEELRAVFAGLLGAEEEYVEVVKNE